MLQVAAVRDQFRAQAESALVGHVSLHRDRVGRDVALIDGRLPPVGGEHGDPPEVFPRLEFVVDERPQAEAERQAERQRARADGHAEERQGGAGLLPPQAADGRAEHVAGAHGAGLGVGE